MKLIQQRYSARSFSKIRLCHKTAGAGTALGNSFTSRHRPSASLGSFRDEVSFVQVGGYIKGRGGMIEKLNIVFSLAMSFFNL